MPKPLGEGSKRSCARCDRSARVALELRLSPIDRFVKDPKCDAIISVPDEACDPGLTVIAIQERSPS